MIEHIAGPLSVFLFDRALIGGETGWEYYVNNAPDDDATSRNKVTLYDTSGLYDGRIANGPPIIHPGYQIKTFAVTQSDARKRLELIANAVDSCRYVTVSFDAESYLIMAVHRRSALSLGRSQEGQRQFQFALNGVATIRKVS